MDLPAISLLIPSRGRAAQLQNMLASVRAVSTIEIESVVRIDADDPQRGEYIRLRDAGIIGVLVEGPRLVMSDLWNDAAKHATADVMMLCGDDLVWRTAGWDVMVREAFDRHPDWRGLCGLTQAVVEARGPSQAPAAGCERTGTRQ